MTALSKMLHQDVDFADFENKDNVCFKIINELGMANGLGKMLSLLGIFRQSYNKLLTTIVGRVTL